MSTTATPPVKYIVRANPAAILARRYELGLTATEVAVAAGISQASMSTIEGGTRTGSAPVMRRIADALGCAVADITVVEAVEAKTG